jgi:hypothetical protein
MQQLLQGDNAGGLIGQGSVASTQRTGGQAGPTSQSLALSVATWRVFSQNAAVKLYLVSIGLIEASQFFALAWILPNMAPVNPGSTAREFVPLSFFIQGSTMLLGRLISGVVFRASSLNNLGHIVKYFLAAGTVAVSLLSVIILSLCNFSYKSTGNFFEAMPRSIKSDGGYLTILATSGFIIGGSLSWMEQSKAAFFPDSLSERQRSFMERVATVSGRTAGAGIAIITLLLTQ